jgi:hypothetical protein
MERGENPRKKEEPQERTMVGKGSSSVHHICFLDLMCMEYGEMEFFLTFCLLGIYFRILTPSVLHLTCSLHRILQN